LRQVQGGIRGRCIGHRAQREVGRTGIEALQTNQPRLVLVEMPACFRIARQNTQHAIGPFERSIRHRLAAAAILLFLGRDPADLEGERRQIGMQFYGHQGTTQVDRRHRVVERGKRLGETPLIEALIHAPNAGCSRLRYPSDLTDDEWGLVEPLIPPGKTGGGKRTVIMREGVNGLMYILSTACQWRAIPKDLPPRSSICITPIHRLRLPH
jgi:hypothetical protein